MRRIILCIATYERAACVRDFLEHCAGYYIRNGIDIAYFDSSPDDETKQAISEWNDDHGKIVQYIRVPSQFHSNRKVLEIYKGTWLPLIDYD